MDLEESLTAATNRIIQLETEIAQWQEKAVDSIPPEVLADNVLKQQVESLTYHVLKLGKQMEKYKSLLAQCNQDRESVLDEIRSLHDEIEVDEEIMDKLKILVKLSEAEPQMPSAPPQYAQPAGGQYIQPMAGQFFFPQMQAMAQMQRRPVTVGAPPKPRRKKTIKDFLELMKRLDHIKLLDASILLDTPPERIQQWAKKMSDKQLIIIEGTDRDKQMLYSTNKMKMVK